MQASVKNKWIDKLGRIWHKTGDIVTERDKFLHMIGRRSNPIKTRVGLLYPIPIENQLDEIENIIKSAYLQIDDKIIMQKKLNNSLEVNIYLFIRSSG